MSDLFVVKEKVIKYQFLALDMENPESLKRFSEKFIDLQNKIRQNHGFKLEMLCKAFGIKNPKAEGVHGDQVSELYEAGEFNKIVELLEKQDTGKLDHKSYVDVPRFFHSEN